MGMSTDSGDQFARDTLLNERICTPTPRRSINNASLARCEDASNIDWLDYPLKVRSLARLRPAARSGASKAQRF